MAEAVVRKVGGGSMELVEGDITALEVDAIVNAANSRLQLGAGVAGAIREKGGPTIQKECDRIGHCPVGRAVVTTAGELPARHVIHAVGPVWDECVPDEADRLLASASRSSLECAAELGITSVALPSISTGVYGFPMERAAGILLREAVGHLQKDTSVQRVIFCLFGDKAFAVFQSALTNL